MSFINHYEFVKVLYKTLLDIITQDFNKLNTFEFLRH